MVMSAAERRAKLQQRMRESSQDRGQRNLGKALKVPLDLSLAGRDVVFFEFKADPRQSNMLDFIPFEITNPEYSKLRQFSGKLVGMGVGDWDYKLEISTHQRIGSAKQTVLCLREMFGLPCPICDDMFAEYAKRKTGGFNEKVAKALQPQWRCVYVVYDYRDPEFQGFKLLDFAYKSFEIDLMEKAETDPSGYVAFSDPEDGRVVEVVCKNEKIGENDFIKPVLIQFLPRSQPWTEEDVRGNFPLDRMLIIPTYEDVCRIYYEQDNGQPEVPGDPPGSPGDPAGVPSRRPAPATAPPPRVAKNECMGNGTLGVDLHKFEACQAACPEEIFARCSEAYERMTNAAADPGPGELMTPETQAPPPAPDPAPPVRRPPPPAASTSPPPARRPAPETPNQGTSPPPARRPAPAAPAGTSEPPRRRR